MSDMGLSIVASGLAADTADLNTAANNLANINTPGYAAEQVNLSPEAGKGPSGSGQGVLIGSVTQPRCLHSTAPPAIGVRSIEQAIHRHLRLNLLGFAVRKTAG